MYIEGQCYNSSSYDACVQNYSGVVDGGRCTFIPNTTANWTAAWTTCQQYGAVLAQIQTNNEYLKIVQLVSVK